MAMTEFTTDHPLAVKRFGERKQFKMAAKQYRRPSTPLNKKKKRKPRATMASRAMLG